jgi:hypothetical protein
VPPALLALVVAGALAGCESLGTSGSTESTQPSLTSTTATTATTGTTGTEGSTTTAPVEVTTTVTPLTTTPGGNAALISQILALATTGMVPDIPFAADANAIDDVMAAWGDPTSQEGSGAGTYDVYAAQHAVFGFNKGNQLFDVRSSSASIQAITWSQVQAVLGPGRSQSFGGHCRGFGRLGASFQVRHTRRASRVHLGRA